MIPRWIQRHFVLTILAIVAVSRLPTFLYPLLAGGEADYAVQTVEWMRGGIPYIDFVSDGSLMIHAWFRWIFEIFGEYNMLAVHVMDLLLVLVTIGGLYAFARYASGERVARWTAVIYAVFQSLGSIKGVFATLPEGLLNAFSVFGAYVFFKSMREDRPGMSLFAGILIGISLVAKISGMVMVIACAASMVSFWYEQSEHRWHRYAEEFFLLLVGLVFPFVLMVSYVSDVGGLEGFIRWSWAKGFSSSDAGATLGSAGMFFAATWALWLLAGWIVVHFIREGRWRAEFVFLSVWLMTSCLFIAAWGWYSAHGLLQLLPPLAMLAAICVVDRWEQFFRGRRVGKRSMARINFAAAAMVLLIPFVASIAVHFVELGGLEDRDSSMMGVASYLKANAQPGERIFVWGHDSAIYFFSRRRPAARFIDCTYLTGGHGVREPDLNAWVMLKRDFDRHPPAFIVDLSPTRRKGFGDFPAGEQLFLANYVHDHYRLAETLYGARIYVRRLR
jgi:hypothetical protein